jgi:hypothetical protein
MGWVTDIRERSMRGWSRRGPLQWAIIGGIAFLVAMILLIIMRFAANYESFAIWVFYLVGIIIGSLILLTFIASFMDKDRGLGMSVDKSLYSKEFPLRPHGSGPFGHKDEHPFFKGFEREFPQFVRYRELKSLDHLHAFYRSKGRHQFDLRFTHMIPKNLLRVQLSQDSDDYMPPTLLRRIELFIERYG